VCVQLLEVGEADFELVSLASFDLDLAESLFRASVELDVS
jgi:sarcosine oxidase gamma subunit